MLMRPVIVALLLLTLPGCSDPAQPARSIVNSSEILVPVVDTRDGTVGSGGYVYYKDYLLETPLSGNEQIVSPPDGFVSEQPYTSPGIGWEYVEQWTDPRARPGWCSILVKRLVNPAMTVERPEDDLLGRGEIVRVEASCG